MSRLRDRENGRPRKGSGTRERRGRGGDDDDMHGGGGAGSDGEDGVRRGSVSGVGGLGGAGAVNPDLPLILFNQSKNELRPLATGGYKLLQSKFRSSFRFAPNKDELTREKLEGAKAIVFPGARQRFDAAEVKVLEDFMASGGGVLFLGSEPTENNPGVDGDDAATGGAASSLLGDDGAARSYAADDYTLAINKVAEPHGIALASDALVRTVYAKEFFHPKEVLLKNAALVRSLDAAVQAQAQAAQSVKSPTNASSSAAPGVPVSALDDSEDPSSRRMSVVYPFGATLKVTKPAVPLLSSGELCFPANRALLAMAKVGRGVLMVMGSTLLLTDEHIHKADNFVLVQSLLTRLITDPLGDAVPANLIGSLGKEDRVEADAPEYGEVVCVPDTEALAERLRCCLQETEELPVDFTQLFDPALFKYDTNLIPEAVRLYERLNVKHEPLSLIPPQFEVPLPPLQPAVFMPCLREPAPPALDLFDLDEHFSTEKLRLAQITNKCTDKDLDYFVCECGEILGIADQLRAQAQEASLKAGGGGPAFKLSANKVLEFILRKLLDWKKLERDAPEDEGMGMGGGGAGFDSNEAAAVMGGPGGSQSLSLEPESPAKGPQPPRARTVAALVGTTSSKAGDELPEQAPSGQMQLPMRRGGRGGSDELNLDDD